MSTVHIKKISNQVKIGSLEEPRLKIFWALDFLSSPQKDRFTSSEIADFLVEEMRIHITRQAIDSVLVKSKGRCNKNKQGYKLMQSGEEDLRSSLTHNKVIFINANEPFSAKNVTVKDILGDTHKEINICDPYVDVNTLDVVFKTFKKETQIRILTSKVVDKPAEGAFKRQLKDLLAEGYKIEVRVYSASGLHDRYIINENNIWFSGNSLNYLGSKESFIIQLGEDMRQSILSTFNNHWKAGVPIQ